MTLEEFKIKFNFEEKSDEDIINLIPSLTFQQKLILLRFEEFQKPLLDTNDSTIKLFLAMKGKFLDKLISDESLFVRIEVARQGFGHEILINDESWLVRFEVRECSDLPCKWEITVLDDNKIKIGCQTKTIEEWDLFFEKKQYIITSPTMFPKTYNRIVSEYQKVKSNLNN